MTAQKHSSCRDENGVYLRSASYTANALNQYSSRSNPASVDIIGLAEVGSSVTVNGSGADYRHGEYFQKDLDVTNNTFAAITVAAGTNSLSGNLYIPPASESYSYDADGNLLADGRWSYLWDAENRLIEIRPQTNAPSAAKIWLKFEYDYLGRRIQKTAAQWTNSAWSLIVSNRFLYDGWNAIAELNATNNTLIRGYLWGIDLSGSLQGAGGVGGLITVKEGAGDAHFAAYDGNGNVIALVNAATGTYSAQYEYDPFGQTIRATGPMAEFNPYRFSTKYQDGESGFYYYGHRYYNPSTGRWVSRDPIEEEGGVNIYAFVSNSPLRFIDVLGMSCDASYAFDDDDAWYEKTAYPRGTKWVRTMAQVKADMISKLKAGCCCFQNVYFSQHSGMPGVLLLGEGSVINPALLKMLQNATNQARQRVAREQLKRETEFLHFVSKFMCKGGTVTFVECDSGAGPEGKALHDWLVSVLGPDVNVTLFESGVRWFYGSPRCTTKSK